MEKAAARGLVAGIGKNSIEAEEHFRDQKRILAL